MSYSLEISTDFVIEQFIYKSDANESLKIYDLNFITKEKKKTREMK